MSSEFLIEKPLDTISSAAPLPISNDLQQNNNEQILNDIQSLQTMEKQLFNSLETNPNLTTEQRAKIVEKMNQISNMRINLYQTISGINTYFQNALHSSQGTLTGQTAAISIVENELNQAKKRLSLLEVEKNNKVRLVQINDYYGDKYVEHGELMKIIIYILVPVIILAILNNKGILPNTIYFILLAIIAMIGGYFFWKRFISIIRRDNMNYQTYDWPFNASSAPVSSTNEGEEVDDPWKSINIATCMGEACCSNGQLYDETLDQCVNNTTTTESFTTEHMVNNILTKGSDKYKTDVTLNGDERVKPITSSFNYKYN
jgi:hypothetical protein